MVTPGLGTQQPGAQANPIHALKAPPQPLRVAPS